MSWLQKCIQTYDDNLHLVGKTTDNIKYPLTPLFFISQKVQIEIELSEQAEFITATRLEGENTLIPATESSGGRGSGIAAHPLCDNLGYLGMSDRGKSYSEKFEAYRKEVSAWAESEFTHEIPRIVLAYVDKKTVLTDLEQACVIERGAPNDKIEKLTVRFVIQKENGERESCATCQSLFRSYEAYCLSKYKEEENGLCYVTGDTVPIAINHPKGIFNGAYGAKLISANDNTNYTFRGRFRTGDEALRIGAVASQKAHNALRWLIANERYICGNRVFVAWNTQKADIPKPWFVAMDEDEEEDGSSTIQAYRAKLKDFMNGEIQALGKVDRGVQIMSLQAATTGRLSITYYNELDGDIYFQRIAQWYGDCCWYFFNKGKGKERVTSPKPIEIVKYAFGTESGAFVDAKEEVLSEQIQTVFHSILDNTPIPNHIKQALVTKCAFRQAYSDGNYSQLIRITCAVLHKNYKDKNKEVKMELDNQERDRSYLFGRILAIAERAERSTYSADEQKREPNAIRLWSAFVQHPMTTWMTLERLLIPYYQKMNTGSRIYYKNLIADIVSLFRDGDMADKNRPLEDMYLIGYYLQRREFFKKSNENENKENEEE